MAKDMPILTVQVYACSDGAEPDPSLQAESLLRPVVPLQIHRYRIQIGKQNPVAVGPDSELRVDFLKTDRFAAAFLRPVPEPFQIREGHIVEFIPVGIENEQEGDAILPLEISHKGNLMLMDVLQAEGIALTFLCVKQTGTP